jgi:hypothetical protein
MREQQHCGEAEEHEAMMPEQHELVNGHGCFNNVQMTGSNYFLFQAWALTRWLVPFILF